MGEEDSLVVNPEENKLPPIKNKSLQETEKDSLAVNPEEKKLPQINKKSLKETEKSLLGSLDGSGDKSKEEKIIDT